MRRDSGRAQGHGLFRWAKVVMPGFQLVKATAAGWVLRGVKGSHRVYTHPVRSGHISVPHPKKDLGAGLLHKLLKQAGMK